MNERQIFEAALSIVSPVERAAYLADACAGDEAKREQVQALLGAHGQLGSFLVAPAAAGQATVREPAAIVEGPGTVIGPYKLLEQIGEGGFGIVFMAEQSTPVRRKVALKVIKPGMDTREVIARFDAERQALAMMEHPHIARVFDAGQTVSGRPYFVMELVKGQPITDYCDRHQLTPKERLELFVAVCQAVQHAHQKGIIHRDIKPSNVLVTQHDDKAVVKVIDFGIAKATTGPLTDKSLFTGFAQMVGTPTYMSPEQAGMSGLDIDTRSDIYSLGVLLYELLTGTTPFDRARLNQAAFEEIRRIIREEEPQKPSTRLSSLGGEASQEGQPGGARDRQSTSLASVAAMRRMEPRKLSQLVRGDLDWIVMKSLEKDRSRRYETANGFAQDVQRYLADEPVQACPPSASYQFRKFVRRNRRVLATLSALSASVLVAALAIGWSFKEQNARELEVSQQLAVKRAKVSGQLELILDEVAQLELAEKWPEALSSARRAEAILALGDAPPDIQTRVQQTLADLQLILRLEDIRAHSGTTWGGLMNHARHADREYTKSFREAGIEIDSLPVAEVVQRITSRAAIAAALLPALDDWFAVRSAGGDEAATRRLSDVVHAADPDIWRRQVRNALARKDWETLERLATSADMQRQPAATVSLISAALQANGRWETQEAVLRRAQRRFPADFWTNHRLGINLVWKLRKESVLEGIGYLRAAVALRPESGHAVMNLGNGFAFLGQYDDAISHFRRALEIRPSDWGSHENLGIALARQARFDEAIAAFEEAIRLKPSVVKEAHAELSMIYSSRTDDGHRNIRRSVELASRVVELDPGVSSHWTALGVARYREGQWQEASTALEKSLQLGTFRAYGQLSWDEAIDCFVLAMCHHKLGQKDEARQFYERGLLRMKHEQPLSELVLRFREEASQLLGLNDAGQRDDRAVGFLQRGQAFEKLGQNDQAQDEYSKAITQYVLLTVAFPVVPEYSRTLIELLGKTGRKQEIEEVYRRAIRSHAALKDAQPAQRLTQANSCNDLAYILLKANRTPEAEEFVRDGLQLKLALVSEFPEKSEYRFHLAHSYLGLATIVAASGRESEALQANRDAEAIFKQLAADESEVPHFRQWNAHALWQLGDAWLRLNRLDDGRQAYEQALQAFRQLAKSDPANRFFRQEQAASHRLLANVAERAGHQDELFRHFREAVTIYEQLTGEVPDSAFYRRELSYVQMLLLDKLTHGGQFDAALEVSPRAIENYKALFAMSPDASKQQDVARWLNDLAWPLVLKSNPPQESIRLADALARRGVELNPVAGHIWSTIAMSSYRAGNWQESLAAEAKASELGFRNGTSQLIAAMTQWQLGNHDQARELCDIACQWIDQKEPGYELVRPLRREAEELIPKGSGDRDREEKHEVEQK